MDEEDAVKSHWAVLIGINFYKEPLKSLEGCVRDVQSIENYLKTRHTPIQIDVLTASTPSDKGSGHPCEKPNLWPTYQNVASRLRKIIEKAGHGDFVYIHFSGHGTQMDARSFDKYSNKDTGDLALVLFDEDTISGTRYLHSRDLADLLNKMVEKGLLVTLVLDCCFSGSVVRRDDRDYDGIRTVTYDPAVDVAYPPRLDINLSFHVGSTARRDAHMLGNLLISPDGYTILSACGPHEIAQELTLGGKKNGALSYFLVRTLLSQTDTKITHQSIYDHLRMKFHVYWPRQTPMRYGNRNFSFFGKRRPEGNAAFIHVLRRPEGDRLYLGAGHVHGVSEDDEYAVYPLESSEDIFKNADKVSFNARVTAVGSVQSDLIVANAKSIAVGPRTRWKARPLTHLSPWKIPVRLMIDDDNQAQWTTLAKSIPYMRLFTNTVEGQPYLFNVTRNEHSEYEILNESNQRINNVPTISAGRDNALRCVLNILEHITTFKYVEGIENRVLEAPFEQSFTVHLRDAAGSGLENWGALEVKDGARVSMTVENFSKQPLYLALFDLGPSWQIDDLVCGSGEGDSLVLPPKNEEAKHTGKKEIGIQMTIPESLRDQDHCGCEDIFKIFITNKPSSFTTFQLPKLPTSANELNESTRRSHRQLLRFLSRLTASRRGTEAETSDNWATRTFVVHTVPAINESLKTDTVSSKY